MLVLVASLGVLLSLFAVLNLDKVPPCHPIRSMIQLGPLGIGPGSDVQRDANGAEESRGKDRYLSLYGTGCPDSCCWNRGCRRKPGKPARRKRPQSGPCPASPTGIKTPLCDQSFLLHTSKIDCGSSLIPIPATSSSPSSI